MRAPYRFLVLAIFLMAGSAILYELLLASILSYLLGATVLYFSLTIGVFLFALGVGAWLSKYIVENILQKFLTLEVILGIAGGFAVPFIFSLYAFFFNRLGQLFSQNQVEAFLFSSGFEIWFRGLTFLYLFGIGVLVGVELPIFTCLANESWALKEALARVFFWDYLGSLAASLLFPLILLPYLGFLRTGFLVGAINLLAALVLSRAMRTGLSLPAKILLIIGAITLILGAVFSPKLEKSFTQKIFAGENILINQNSHYQNILLSRDPRDRVSLFLNLDRQFQSGLSDARYHEIFVHPAMAFLGERAKTILILGGGDGLALRELFKYGGVKSITMIDIDPAITGLALNDPTLADLNKNSMRDPRLKVINADAFRWLLDRPHHAPPFDLIFIDFPDPADDTLKRLYSQEFYLLVKRHMYDNGLAIIQADSLPSKSHETTKKTLHSAGFHILTLHSIQPQNKETQGIFDAAFIAASPSSDTIRHLYENMRTKSLPIPDGLRTINKEAQNHVLDPYLDIGEAENVSPNSIFHPASFGIQRGLFMRLLQLRYAPDS